MAVIESGQHGDMLDGLGKVSGGPEAIMRKLQDVEVTVIEIDSDGDGFGDEELVIVEDTDG
jgi:hypothetical protein